MFYEVVEEDFLGSDDFWFWDLLGYRAVWCYGALGACVIKRLLLA